MTINQGIQYIKNPYLFSHNENELDNLDNTSYIDEISHSVKPIDKKKANIEAEQHEVLLEDGKLYNILGKPHSKGGTPLNAKEGSFIFSKFTPLAINKKDKKLFELNAVKSDKNKNNSPAQILKKEINLKHHNKMFKVLEDDLQDDISKKSANLMLSKNLDIVGKIGYLQEEKKDFPNGIPDFSNGTTPKVDKQLENKIMQSNQFMQLGGMKKYAPGGEIVPLDSCPYGKRTDGSCKDYSELTEFEKAELLKKPAYNSNLNTFKSWESNVNNFYGTKYNADTLNRTNVSNVQNQIATNNPELVSYAMSHGMLPTNYNEIVKNKEASFNDGLYTHRQINPFIKKFKTQAEIDADIKANGYITDSSLKGFYTDDAGKYNSNTPNFYKYALEGDNPNSSNGLPNFALNLPKSSTPGNEIYYTPPTTPTPQPPTNKQDSTNDLHPNDPLNYSNNPFNSQARLTNYQNANTAYLLGQGLNVKKYVPMRPQIRSNIPFVETLDYQPLLNQIDNGVAQQYDAGRFSSSPQQGALNSLISGKALQAKSQAIGQVNAQNVGLRNQQRAIAAQTLNQDNQFNIAQNQDYYNKVQMANSNYDTLKQAGINAALADYNTNLTALDKFKQLEASQKMGQQYVRATSGTNKGKIELRDKEGNSFYLSDDELKTKKNDILKNGWTIQTNQVPLFSTDRYGRVRNNIIDVNPLGMAGKGSSVMTKGQVEAAYFDGAKITNAEYNQFMANFNGKNEDKLSKKYGGKITKRYTVKNPFN